MYFHTSSERRLPDLPLHRLDLPQVRPVFSFANRADQALRKLSGLRLRVTLCRIALDQGAAALSRSVINEIVARIDDQSLIVGTERDGGIVILALGRRDDGRRGDLQIELSLQETLGQAVAAALAARNATLPVRMVLVHHWSDELDAETSIAAVTKRAEKNHSAHALSLAA